MRLGALFPNHEPSRKVADPVFLGGPMGPEVIFALVQRKESPGNRSLQIAPGFYLATDSSVVDKIIESDPSQARFFAGVVMWQSGELAEELRRVIPVLERLAGELPVSIDTSKAEVARRALALGAELVNDVTGLRGDAELAEVIAKSDAYVCLMHMLGAPRTMHDGGIACEA